MFDDERERSGEREQGCGRAVRISEIDPGFISHESAHQRHTHGPSLHSCISLVFIIFMFLTRVERRSMHDCSCIYMKHDQLISQATPFIRCSLVLHLHLISSAVNLITQDQSLSFSLL